MVGPPLSDFARRTYIAGNLFNTPDNLVAWIRSPDSVEPGTVMPTLGVTEQEARDISAYLYLETSTGGLGPPRLLSPTLLPHE
jgi:cytochrome c1